MRSPHRSWRRLLEMLGRHHSAVINGLSAALGPFLGTRQMPNLTLFFYHELPSPQHGNSRGQNSLRTAADDRQMPQTRDTCQVGSYRISIQRQRPISTDKRHSFCSPRRPRTLQQQPQAAACPTKIPKSRFSLFLVTQPKGLGVSGLTWQALAWRSCNSNSRCPSRRASKFLSEQAGATFSSSFSDHHIVAQLESAHHFLVAASLGAHGISWRGLALISTKQPGESASALHHGAQHISHSPSVIDQQQRHSELCKRKVV